MIVVKIELWRASDGGVETLGVMKITNDGTGTLDKSHYKADVMRKPDFKSVTRSGKLRDWPRLKKTIWHMVAALLKDMGYVE